MADIDVRSAASNNRGTRDELRDVRRRTMRLRRWVGPQRDVIARLAALIPNPRGDRARQIAGQLS